MTIATVPASTNPAWTNMPDEADVLPDGQRRCKAHASHTGRDGNPPRRCRRPAIPGGFVCRVHGGATPQAIRKARLRLIELVDPAIATMARVMASPDSTDANKLRAAENILDRAGYPRKTEVDTEAAKTTLLMRLDLLRQRLADGQAAGLDDPLAERAVAALDPDPEQVIDAHGDPVNDDDGDLDAAEDVLRADLDPNP